MALIITCLSLISCYHDPIIPQTPAISFSTQVQPIIIGNCTQSGCHGSDGRDLQLLTYTEVMQYVTPDNAHASSLYTILTDIPVNRMPPSKYLTDNEINTIYLWIEQGARNN